MHGYGQHEKHYKAKQTALQSVTKELRALMAIGFRISLLLVHLPVRPAEEDLERQARADSKEAHGRVGRERDAVSGRIA